MFFSVELRSGVKVLHPVRDRTCVKMSHGQCLEIGGYNYKVLGRSDSGDYMHGSQSRNPVTDQSSCKTYTTEKTQPLAVE